MESQPQNPEFRINPENFHPCACAINTQIPKKKRYLLGLKDFNSETILSINATHLGYLADIRLPCTQSDFDFPPFNAE